MISGFVNVSRPLQNQHYLSLETPRHLNKIKNISWIIFETYYVCKYDKNGTCRTPAHCVFVVCVVAFSCLRYYYVCWKLEYLIVIMLCEDEDRIMMKIG